MGVFAWHADSWLSGAALADGPLDWMFDIPVLFKPWPWKIFSRDNWNSFTTFLSIGLALAGAALLLLEQHAKRTGVKVPEQSARRIGIAFTVIGFLLYFDFFNPNTRYLQ